LEQCQTPPKPDAPRVYPKHHLPPIENWFTKGQNSVPRPSETPKGHVPFCYELAIYDNELGAFQRSQTFFTVHKRLVPGRDDDAGEDLFTSVAREAACDHFVSTKSSRAWKCVCGKTCTNLKNWPGMHAIIAENKRYSHHVMPSCGSGCLKDANKELQKRAKEVWGKIAERLICGGCGLSAESKNDMHTAIYCSASGQKRDFDEHGAIFVARG
jgi:hypothetical protein